MKPMKAVLVDVKNEVAKVVEIDRSLEAYYEAIGCRCIDMVCRRVGRRKYLIICDDEGLLKESPKISAINNLGEPMLVGNLIICKNSGEYEKGLTDEDVRYVLDRVVTLSTRLYPQGYPMLTQVEY